MTYAISIHTRRLCHHCQIKRSCPVLWSVLQWTIFRITSVKFYTLSAFLSVLILPIVNDNISLSDHFMYADITTVNLISGHRSIRDVLSEFEDNYPRYPYKFDKTKYPEKRLNDLSLFSKCYYRGD